MMKKINLDEFWNKRYPYGKLPKYAKDIALDLIKEVLELAAENAEWGVYQNDDGQEPWIHESNIFIDKQSILGTINQIE